jgi:glyoxylase-like metal-dependent hydrolase (beta-lactamase superfamily II)
VLGAYTGDRFDQLFDPIVAIPNERLLIKGEGDTLTIGPHRTLSFLDTPGHAAHHFSIYDPVSNGIFTGDTAGIRYHQVTDLGFTLYLPTTTPNQFDPDAMLNSINRFREMQVEKIYFSHFGMTTDIKDAFQQVSYWIPRFVEIGEQALSKGEGVEKIAAGLLHMISNYLSERKVADNHPVYDILKLDLEIDAMGIVYYLNKRKKTGM